MWKVMFGAGMMFLSAGEVAPAHLTRYYHVSNGNSDESMDHES